MKRQLQRLLALMMLLALVMSGCANSDKENTAEQTTEAGTTAEAETLEPPIQIENIADYVELGKYMGVEAAKESAELTDKEIEDKIKAFCEQNATLEQIKEGKVKDGDTVNINYVGKMDGVAFEGGTGEYDLKIGSDSFIDGFEDGLIGVEVGSTVDLNLKFPDPYKNNPDLAGKPVVFTVTVNYIQGTEKIVPEFDDELAVSQKYKDAEEMREDLVDDWQKEKESTVEQNYQIAIWDNLIADSKITRHEGIYESYYSSFIEQYEYIATMYGMTLESYLTAVGASTKEFYAMAEEYAESCMNQELICRAIVEKEKMTVSDEEYAKTLTEYYEQYKTSFKDEAELENYYGKERLTNDILWTNVMDMVLENAVPVDPPAEESTDAAAESTAAAE